MRILFFFCSFHFGWLNKVHFIKLTIPTNELHIHKNSFSQVCQLQLRISLHIAATIVHCQLQNHHLKNSQNPNHLMMRNRYQNCWSHWNYYCTSISSPMFTGISSPMSTSSTTVSIFFYFFPSDGGVANHDHLQPYNQTKTIRPN